MLPVDFVAEGFYHGGLCHWWILSWGLLSRGIMSWGILSWGILTQYPEMPLIQSYAVPEDAPRVSYVAPIIQWTQDGVAEYQVIVSEQLRQLRNTWPKSDSKALISVYIKCTNDILINCAMETNPWYLNNSQSICKPKSIPRLIKQARRKLKRKFDNMCRRNTTNSRAQFDTARRAFKQTVRKISVKNSVI